LQNNLRIFAAQKPKNPPGNPEMTVEAHQPVRIVILASGTGSNAQKIMEYFRDKEDASVVAVFSNNPEAGVLQKAAAEGVYHAVMGKEQYAHGPALRDLLQSHQADLVVLAGYLKLIPAEVVAAFPDRIVNIHPSLLPKYGGKGMYGGKVHQAVIQNGEAYSGITIHFVNERYDEGAIILQKKVAIQPGWTQTDLESAIHHLEHTLFPGVLADLARHIQRKRAEGPQ
jgi:phosphoribosylglycinamide formyltransferase-1